MPGAVRGGWCGGVLGPCAAAGAGGWCGSFGEISDLYGLVWRCLAHAACVSGGITLEGKITLRHEITLRNEITLKGKITLRKGPDGAGDSAAKGPLNFPTDAFFQSNFGLNRPVPIS